MMKDEKDDRRDMAIQPLVMLVVSDPYAWNRCFPHPIIAEFLSVTGSVKQPMIRDA